MPGLVDILRESADHAARIADGLRASRSEAEALSRVRAPQAAPPPPSPPPGPGGIVLGPDGTPAIPSGRGSSPPPRVTTSPGGGAGGGAGIGSGGGAGSGGRGFTSPSSTPDPWVESTQGGIRLPLSWISTHCTLVDQPVLGSLGAPTGQTRKVWDCGDLGTFIPPSTPSTISKTSSGGGAGRSAGSGRGSGLDTGSVARPNIPVSGVATGGVERGQNVNPPGFSGPQSITGEVSAPGVERELQRTNDLLARSLQPDNGAALRAAGGL